VYQTHTHAAAVRRLAFGYLGARSAVTGAYRDNPALAGVNRALGYRDDGTEVEDREGKRVLARRFRMEPNDVPES
jgi:RimJ/RimL family protein N-acetyltransferase